MSVTKTNLITKAIAIPFNSEIFHNLFLSYALLIGLPLAGVMYSDSFTIFSWIGEGLFFPISMTALRSYEDNSNFSVPTKELILKKFWKIFQVVCISLPIFAIGLICLIVPGFIVWKRYIYVFLISEQEMLGPLDSMRKSTLMSQRNGWRLLLMTFILLFITSPLFLISFFLSENNTSILIFILQLAVSWIAILSSTAICFYGYKEASAND